MRISRRQASMALVVFGVIVGCTSEREAPREHVTSTREALSIAVPFTFPLGQSLFTTPLYAKSGLQIGAGTTVEAGRGQIANASSTFVLGANAQIGDASLGNEVSVIAGGSAVLGANSRITGFLQPTQQVQQGANSLVALGVRSPQPFPSLRTFNIEATFPTPTAAIIVGANQQTTIPPGTSYTALTLGAGATAHLSAGRYYFGSVTIGSQATLDIDDTQGEVIIFAAGAWTSAGKSIFRKGPEGLAVVRLGNGGTTITQPFSGTIVAPSGDVTLSAGTPGFSGEYIGDRVTVGANTRVKLRSFSGWGALLCDTAPGPTVEQARSLPTTCDKPSRCCPPTLSRVTLASPQDLYDVEGPNTCVVASDGGNVITGCKMAGSTILGGDGADTMQLGQGVIAYGGAGDDRIETFGNSVLYGNAGDDILVAHAGSNVIFPGAGRDEVHTGTGDDVVVVFDACEIMSGEVIDLGEGHDVVISPLTRQELLARGVTLVGVEEVQVQGDPCKAECRNPPACVSAGVCTVNADQSLGCTCPPWAEGYRCEIPKDLPFNSTPPPALDGVDEGTRLQQATAFLRWFMNGTNSDRGATRTLLDGTRGNLKIRAAFAAAGREYLHSASADAQVVAIEILGYLQCRDCIEVLIEAFPTTVPNVPVGFHGGDPKSTARAVQSLLAFELAGAGLLRTKTFLLEHLARHEDEFVRRSIVFAMKQAYGESIRSSVAAVARQEDMVAFDWVSNADPDFNSKLRARYNH